VLCGGEVVEGTGAWRADRFVQVAVTKAQREKKHTTRDFAGHVFRMNAQQVGRHAKERMQPP
jgi:hypothetical protein